MRVGVLGCGNVGAPLVELIARAGRHHRGPHRPAPRGHPGRRARPHQAPARSRCPPTVLTDDAGSIVDDPDIDLVVELIGGVEPARDLILTALKAGKPVITGNKELLAKHGAELFEAAERGRRRPALRGGRRRRHPDHPAAARVAGGGAHHPGDGHRQRHHQLHPHADDRGRRVLRRRPGRGAGARATPRPTPPPTSRATTPAPRPPSSPASPSAPPSPPPTSHHEGITGITEVDIAFAGKMGYVVKLLAVAEQTDAGAIGVRVHPTMVPLEHPLAAVRESFNAIFVEGAAVGDLMFYGRGAGGSPTASAILGDLIDAAVNRHKGSHASVGQLEPGGAPPDRRRRVRLLPQRRGARPAGRAGPGRRRVRRQRRVDPLDGAGGPRRRGPPHLHHPPRPRTPTCRPPSRALGELEAVDRIGSVLRVLGDDL